MRTVKLFVFTLIFICSHVSFSQKIPARFFKKTNKFFKHYVVRGNVDYLRIIKNPKKLNQLVQIIAQANVHSASAKKKKAFYINAYNVLLVKNIVKHYPVLFPLEEPGLFSSQANVVAGETLTLNQIENEKLIKEYKDVRILFVLSSASKGSLPVARYAYKPGKLEKQFNKRIKATANDFDYIRVMKRSSKILLAEAFKRSLTDFNKKDIVEYINKYREDPLPPDYVIDFYPANRKLNLKD